MTDEEIEKALECCACLTKSGCTQCPLQSKSARYACTIDMSRNALDYITRLKAENENMYGELMNYKAYIDNHEEIWKRNAEIDKEQVRKDTAKEIIGELKGDMAIATFTFNPALASELKTIYLRLQKEYEVDDE